MSLPVLAQLAWPGIKLVFTTHGHFIALDAHGCADELWNRVRQLVAAIGYRVDPHLEAAADFDDEFGQRYMIIREIEVTHES